MNGKVIKGWDKVDLANDRVRGQFVEQIDRYLSAPILVPELRGALQHFSMPGDVPSTIRDLIEKFNATDDYDAGWQMIFDHRVQTEGDGFDLMYVDHGFTFDSIKIGERVQVRGLTSSKERVSFTTYADAVGWHKELFEDRKWIEMEDSLEAMRAAAYRKQAEIHYTLVEATTNTEDFAGESTDDEAVRDAKTINSAVVSIYDDLQDTAISPGANAQFVVLAPIALKERITAAIYRRNQAFDGSAPTVVFGVQPVFTNLLSSSSYYYVVLPKRTLKSRTRVPLELDNGKDNLSFTYNVSARMRIGAGVGIDDQIYKCETAD